MTNQISNYFDKLKNSLDDLNFKEIEVFVEIMKNARETNKKIFVCGNGGSASTASHFACDINKGVSYGSEQRFKVISLVDNLPILSAYSNDISYDVVFEEQLKNYFNEEDILIAISGSGNSKNVVKAVDFVNNNNGMSIGWTGFDGGKLKEKCHHCINVNVNDMQITEDIHMILVHVSMRLLSD